jgi:citrate synthase
MQIALKSDFLSTSHCLLYGELPGAAQAEEFRSTVMRFSKLPSTVIDAMEALPTNAHPMSVVMSAVIALGALHPEQNPALAGNSIYKNKSVQDTQIVRLLGAMPSISAYAYYRCALVLFPLNMLKCWHSHAVFENS